MLFLGLLVLAAPATDNKHDDKKPKAQKAQSVKPTAHGPPAQLAKAFAPPAAHSDHQLTKRADRRAKTNTIQQAPKLKKRMYGYGMGGMGMGMGGGYGGMGMNPMMMRGGMFY